MVLLIQVCIYLYLSFYQGHIQLGFDTLDAVSVLPKKNKNLLELKILGPSAPPSPTMEEGFAWH